MNLNQLTGLDSRKKIQLNTCSKETSIGNFRKTKELLKKNKRIFNTNRNKSNKLNGKKNLADSKKLWLKDFQNGMILQKDRNLNKTLSPLL